MKKIIKTIIFTSLLSCSSTKHPILMENVVGFKKENHLAKAKKIIMATQGRFSTAAGLEMINAGGNIIDAMAAISFVISVERPQSTGIGGGGFLLYYSKKHDKTFAFDFRERAPLNAHAKIYLDKKGNVIPRKSLDGIHAVGTPGLVAGVLEIHKKFGRLPLNKILKPAIDLAKNGLEVYPELNKALNHRKSVLCKFPSSQKIFCPNGKLLKTGELLQQKDLANTLSEIAKKGRNGFYRGQVAKNIVATSKRYNGRLAYKDLLEYKVRYRTPVEGTYRGNKIVSMPPPSSGGVHIIQILNTLENIDLKSLGIYHPQTIHYVSSAMEMAFADRAKFLGDDDFQKVPKKGLSSKSYARKLFEKINANKAFSKDEIRHGNPWDFGPDHTTHFSLMDREGNVVVSTQTINGYFGSGLVAQNTGIVLNNEMDDFANKIGAANLFGAIGGEKNLVEPGKRPLSSMSPTIVFKGGKPIMGVGTPSGTRILTCVMNTILNYFEFDLSLYDSVATARYHHQWRPHYIRFDKGGIKDNVKMKLEKMGHKVVEKNLGCRIQAVTLEGDNLIGVSDPRGEGKAAGI